VSGPIARGLRRIADVLQRGLFDAEEERLPEIEVPVAADALRHPRANRELVLDGRRIAFLLKRSRRRSIGFVVGLEGLAVSAPKWVTLRDIDAAVREKGGWILAKLDEQRQRSLQNAAERIVWGDGATLQFLGAPVRVTLAALPGLAAGEVRLEELQAGAAGAGAATAAPLRRLHVGLPIDVSPERLRDVVQSWLQREARRLFEARSAHFAERLGVRVTRLSLSSAKTRWGSANAGGAIRLHWRLVQYPLATIDYVVAHELAHLREMNHGPRFWAVVGSVVPDYRAARSQLSSEPLAAWD
jgi:predicted metal-dependent hydrolase